QAIARILDDAAPMLPDLRINHFAEVGLEALVGAFLVSTHQTRIPRDIGGEDGGKTADSGHCSPSATKFTNQAYNQICLSRQCGMWVKLPNPSAVESSPAGRKAHGAVKDRFGSNFPVPRRGREGPESALSRHSRAAARGSQTLPGTGPPLESYSASASDQCRGLPPDMIEHRPPSH